MVTIDHELEVAISPEDFFGANATLDYIKALYRETAKVVHPDKGIVANAKLFQKLQALYDLAVAKLAEGTYGDGKPLKPIATIRTKTNAYNIWKAISESGVSIVYDSTDINGVQYYFKVAKHPRDNDLLVREAAALQTLDGLLENKFVPIIKDDFTYREAGTNAIRQVLLLDPYSGFVSLKQVKEIYPKGIDAKDVTWIFRRVLYILSYLGGVSLVHGAIVPSNILVHPETHNLLLINWELTTNRGSRLVGINSEFKELYPTYAFDKLINATKTMDIYMAVESMLYIAKGEALPMQISTFMRGAKLANDSSTLWKEFDELIERLWGPRAFHPFSMKVSK